MENIFDTIREEIGFQTACEIAKKISEVANFIELEKFDEAKEVIEQIEKITGGEIHETVKYKTAIDMMKDE